MFNSSCSYLKKSLLKRIRQCHAIQADYRAARGEAPDKELVYYCTSPDEIFRILDRLVLPVTIAREQEPPLTLFCGLAKPDPGDVWTPMEKLLGPPRPLEDTLLSFPAARMGIDKKRTVGLLELREGALSALNPYLGSLPASEQLKWRVYEGPFNITHIDAIDLLFWDGSWRSIDELWSDEFLDDVEG
jgi:hypothetical protein